MSSRQCAVLEKACRLGARARNLTGRTDIAKTRLHISCSTMLEPGPVRPAPNFWLQGCVRGYNAARVLTGTTGMTTPDGRSCDINSASRLEGRGRLRRAYPGCRVCAF